MARRGRKRNSNLEPRVPEQTTAPNQIKLLNTATHEADPSGVALDQSNMANEKISFREFMLILTHFSNMEDHEKQNYAKYFLIKKRPKRRVHRPGEPLFKIEFNPKYVEIKSTSEDTNLYTRGELGLDFLNWTETAKKRDAVRRRLRDGDKNPCLLMQGDSWFEYPVFIKDVSDYLLEEFKYNAYSHSAAGAELQDMVNPPGGGDTEYNQAFRSLVAWNRPPQAILVSGGGNDLVGDNFHKLLIKLQSESANPLDHLNSTALERTLGTLIKHYRKIMTDLEGVRDELVKRKPSLEAPLNFVFHCYDYGIPAPQDVNFDVPPVDGWTGKPLRAANVHSAAGQAAIIKRIIDGFHTELVKLAEDVEKKKGPIKVHIVDGRGVVPAVSARQTGVVNGIISWIAPPKAGWNDELHPNDLGFKQIASKFNEKIEKILNGAV